MPHVLLQPSLPNRVKTLFDLPKVKPLNDRKTAKAKEGKLKALISNKQRAAWLNVIKSTC